MYDSICSKIPTSFPAIEHHFHFFRQLYIYIIHTIPSYVSCKYECKCDTAVIAEDAAFCCMRKQKLSCNLWRLKTAGLLKSRLHCSVARLQLRTH